MIKVSRPHLEIKEYTWLHEHQIQPQNEQNQLEVPSHLIVEQPQFTMHIKENVEIS